VFRVRDCYIKRHFFSRFCLEVLLSRPKILLKKINLDCGRGLGRGKTNNYSRKITGVSIDSEIGRASHTIYPLPNPLPQSRRVFLSWPTGGRGKFLSSASNIFSFLVRRFVKLPQKSLSPLLAYIPSHSAQSHTLIAVQLGKHDALFVLELECY
jgi:hypothetical protein